METAKVPVDLLHWVLAILPIVAQLVFLVPLRWRIWPFVNMTRQACAEIMHT